MTDASALRLAATVLVVRDDPFQVLMVRRPSRGTFASALVFPGGGIEPDDSAFSWSAIVSDWDEFEPDERALRIGAIRETWEETALLLGGSETALITADSFPAAVDACGGISLGSLAAFGHWVTPEIEARRFDTHFYLAIAPADQDARSATGETVSVEWISPVEAAVSTDRGIIFPTLMNLSRLAESTSAASAMQAARARAPFTVLPTGIRHPDGTRTITISPDAGYPLTTFTF